MSFRKRHTRERQTELNRVYHPDAPCECNETNEGGVLRGIISYCRNYREDPKCPRICSYAQEMRRYEERERRMRRGKKRE